MIWNFTLRGKEIGTQSEQAEISVTITTASNECEARAKALEKASSQLEGPQIISSRVISRLG